MRMILLSFPALAIAAPAFGLQPLQDEALSSISGRDGITLQVETPASGQFADELRMVLDPGQVNEAQLSYHDINMSGVDVATGTTGGIATFTNTFDAGALVAAPSLSYKLEVSNGRLSVDGLTHGAATDDSYGAWALDATTGTLHIIGDGGLFNSTTTGSYLFGELTDSRIYYRQLDAANANRAYMIMDNLQARWEMDGGTLGINNEGIIMETSRFIDVTLDFDFYHKTGGVDFTPGGRGLMHFGWAGGIQDPQILWRTRNASADPALTQGVINLSSRWNYIDAGEAALLGDPDLEFRWRLGETGGTASPVAGDTRVQFETADWETWGGHAYGHDWPMIALDVISGTRMGDMSLCWGAPNSGACTAQTVNLEPGYVNGTAGNKGLAIWTRDGNLQSYSRKINLIIDQWNDTTDQYEMLSVDPSHPYYSPNATMAVDWGLIYSFANVDGNIFVHPGGNPDDPTKGMMLDVLLMSQTFDVDDPTTQGFNWDTGSHLMIADTDIDRDGITGETRDAMGIGLIGTSFLLQIDDARLWVKPRESSYAFGSVYNSGGLDVYSPRTRFGVNTTFGGGVLPDDLGGYGTGPRYALAAIVTANLEGAANMRISPSDPASTEGQNYLGYSWGFRLMDLSDSGGNLGFGASPYGNYIALAEPSRPEVTFRLANITGDLAFTEGKVDVYSHLEDSSTSTPEVNGKPKMVISNKMLIGSAATPRLDEVGFPASSHGSELRVGRMMLGDASLGQIVIPSAQVYSSITLEPQR